MEATQSSHLKWLQIAGITAVIAALIGMIGDICLLYSPNGGYEAGDFEFLRAIPNSRLIWGHYLGLVAIPFESAGIYLVWLALAPLGKKTAWAAAIFGLYLMFIGVGYHVTVYPLADAIRTNPAQVEAFRPFSEPLGLVFAIAFFVAIAALTLVIARGKTRLPKWFAFVSPLATYPLWVLAYLIVPSVGNLLAPTGFNLSMAIFFGLMTWKAKAWALSIK